MGLRQLLVEARWLAYAIVVSLLSGCAVPGRESTAPVGLDDGESGVAETDGTGAPPLPKNPDGTASPPQGGLAPVARPPPVIAAIISDNVVAFSFQSSTEPLSIRWEFGDGSMSADPAPVHTYYSAGTFTARLELHFTDGNVSAAIDVRINRVPFLPHVVVGVPDSGINPYHDVYSRPELTVHPCTYILDYPCEVPALELTLDAPDWQAAFEADLPLWQSIQPGDRYWIPGTNIIGAACYAPYFPRGDVLAENGLCIIDDSSMHGTGTTSSVLSENPEALLVFVEGNSPGVNMLLDGYFPIDVISYSWGAPAPILLWGVDIDGPLGPMYVAAAGNEGGFPASADAFKNQLGKIIVGAADGASRTEPGYSGWKTADFASEYCRPTAQTKSLSEMRPSYCGTSFSAPTFAGALSKVILDVRRASGYTGSIVDGMVDPVLGISKWAVRDALNRTASYAPDSPFANDPHDVPLFEPAPYYQWGWGYYARNDAGSTVTCLLQGVCPTKDDATRTYMDLLWTYRTCTSTFPADNPDCP